MNDTIQYDIRILALDTALATTGYAIYLVSSRNNFMFWLERFGTINTNSESVTDDTDSRVRFVLQEVEKLIEKHDINFLLSEEPSETIYGCRIPNVLIGRATAIMKLVAAVYGIVGWAYKSNLYCRTVNPTSWQSQLFGKLKKGTSKKTSLKYANDILKHLGYLTKLKTKEEENIADAICIGFSAIRNLADGKWALPQLKTAVTQKYSHA